MDFDSLVDDSKKTQGVPSAGTSVSFDSLQDDSEKYGDGLGQVKAFGLGAARSASFGLSDEFLTRVAGMSPEDIKGYREANPISSGAGEVAGVLGAVLAPEVGILGAAAAPVKAVARVGGAVTEALAPAAATTVGKILSQAGAHAAGSAIEGAAYGLGQSVSEHALGDPDLNAEKVLANVGTSALVGGALGSLFGAVKGGAQAAFPKFFSEVDRAAIEGGDWDAMVRNSDLPESEKTGFIKALTKRKANAPEIEKAAQELGAPVLPGMISDNALVQKGQSALLEGPPSVASLRAQGIAAEGYEKATNAMESAIGQGDDITKAGLGDTLKTLVSDTVEKQSAPIGALYDELKRSYQVIPTSEKALKQIAGNIRRIEDVPLSPQARAIAESAAERVESIKTVDDVKRLRSILNQELGISATPIQKRVTAIISDKLADLEENSIVRFAKNEMKTSKAKNKIMQLLGDREAANAQYSVFKDKIQRLGEVLGRKRVHGAQDFLDFIGDLTPEKIADKLSGKNNSEFLEWFSKELPEGMGAISQYQRGIIREAAMKDGKFNINRALSMIDKMPKEYRSKIFTPEELSRLDAVKTYTQAFPKNFNPSNTANASAFRSFFEHPVGSLVANARDFAIQGFIESASSSGDKTKAFIDGLSAIERSAQKTSKSIGSGVNAIFSPKEGGSPAKGYLAITSGERRDSHDKHSPEISEMISNPEKLINKISQNTEAMSVVAPKTAAAAQSTMVRATRFLNSKLPGAGVPKRPLSPKYKPSDAELAKWHKYFSAVENPTDILKSVAQGSIVPEQMEAVSVVYPRLMQEMQVAVTDKLTDAIAKKKVITYRTKLALSMFLGSDLVNSLDPKVILATQNTMTTATQAKDQQEQMAGVNTKSLGKMNESNRLMTSMQKSSQREDA